MRRIYLSKIDSTNTWLKEHYFYLQEFTFVRAEEQTAGRGRGQRVWESRKDNLYFSLLLKENAYFEKGDALSVVSALSVLNTLREYNVRNLQIKWPNDVYADGKKICGILIESVYEEKPACLIVGIGVNVNQNSFTGEYAHTPTSVILETGENTDLDALELRMYEEFQRNMLLLKEGHDFFEEIAQYDYLKGKEVYGVIKGEKKLVKVEGMRKDYKLRVVSENETYDLYSDEVTFHL